MHLEHLVWGMRMTMVIWMKIVSHWKDNLLGMKKSTKRDMVKLLFMPLVKINSIYGYDK